MTRSEPSYAGSRHRAAERRQKPKYIQRFDQIELTADDVLRYYHDKVQAMPKQDRMAVARKLALMFDVAGQEYVDDPSQERNCPPPNPDSDGGKNEMAAIIGKADIHLVVKFEITEAEARALDALIGYGFINFKTAFYERLGRSYMEPHEEGLKMFFESVKANIPHLLSRTDNARKVFRGELLVSDKVKIPD